MTTILEIEGNLVRQVERNVVTEVPLADMLAHLERRPPVSLPMLPRNRTIGLHWDESNPPLKVFNIAIAQPPVIRLLPMPRGYALEGVPPRLAMPWTIYVFNMRTRTENPNGRDWGIDSVTFWFSKDEPKGDATDNLIPALLPNVYSNAAICWGNTGVNANQPLMDRIDETVNTFYQTEFTHAGDIDRNWPYKKLTYRRWARETAETGAGAYRLWTDWDDDTRTHKTLREVLGTPPDITVPLALPNAIPDIITNPSFGRAEEWLRGLNQMQRHRLHVAMTNIGNEDPNAFAVPAIAPVAQAELDDEDDR